MSYFKNEKHYSNYCLKIISDRFSLGKDYKKDLSQTLISVYQWSNMPLIEKLSLRLGIAKGFHSMVSWKIREVSSNGDDDEVDILLENVMDLPSSINTMIDEFIYENQVKNNANETHEKLSTVYKHGVFYYFFPFEQPEPISVGGVYEGFVFSKEFCAFCVNLKREKGVYLLYDKNEELIYIGKSRSLGNRMMTSAAERKAHFVSYAVTKTFADMNIYEPYLIAMLKPTLNTQFHCKDHPTFELPTLDVSELIKTQK